MKNFLFTILVLLFFILTVNSQYSDGLKLKNTDGLLYDNSDEISNEMKLCEDSYSQVKTRNTVNMYFGAGYSFVIFTNNIMNTGYPIIDLNSGDFLSEVNLFFGFSIAKAVTIEIEPSILFTRNNSAKELDLTSPLYFPPDTSIYKYDFPSSVSMISFPIAVNVRFFPLYKNKGFTRLFFIGGGLGAVWIREEYDHVFTSVPYYNGNIYYGNSNYYAYTSSTNQWAPIFRILTGFTGSGGAFGFGGEIRYSFIPLKSNSDPFKTRIAKNANSVDLALRFYFSL